MFSNQRPYTVEEIQKQVDIYEGFLDYLEDPVFETHIDWDGDDFYKFVQERISNAKSYIQERGLELGVLGSGDMKVEHIVDNYEHYPEMIFLALQGKRAKAYQVLESSIVKNLESFAFYSFKSLPGHPVFDDSFNLQAYRIRVGQDEYNSNFSREDLFHIPFELNHLIANNRFSLSGFPCLYMSNTVYACWEELGRPNIDKCFVSAFDITNLSFFDLSLSPREVTEKLRKHCNFLKKANEPLQMEYVESFVSYLTDYLYLWPAIFCSSIKVRNQNSVFKPEYIFPQLILEWFVSVDVCLFDGIKFRSTKNLSLEGKIEEESSLLAKNYVIPARKYSHSGFCREYVRKVKLTQPINYAFQSLLGRNVSVGDNCNQYSSTVFGKIERMLLDEGMESIQQN
ncbi:hypothetical protein ACT0GK_004461 [Vibrio parahaemolyticus]